MDGRRLHLFLGVWVQEDDVLGLAGSYPLQVSDAVRLAHAGVPLDLEASECGPKLFVHLLLLPLGQNDNRPAARLVFRCLEAVEIDLL